MTKKERQRAWYRRHKKRKIADTAQRRRERREWLDELKAQLKCERCDENHPACLDFHHRDPDTKEFELSAGVHRSLAKLWEEIEKCDILCANCHRKETFKGK